MTLSREEAQKFLKEEQTPNWQQLCLSAIESELSGPPRAVAYALLDHDEHGRPAPPYLPKPQALQLHQQAVALNLQQLPELSAAERQTMFAALVPQTAIAVDAAWQLQERLPYQMHWQRQAFRAPTSPQAHHQKRSLWLKSLLPHLTCYRDKDLAWFATWAPQLAHLNTQTFGILFAAAINEGGAEADALFDLLASFASGESEVGKMGRHVTTALLVAARPDGWDCIERLLLAAQREEGLRQVILETVDEAHPQAFRRMLQLILDHNLLRFSATVRAADVWFGFGHPVEAASDLRNVLQLVLSFLDDPASCYEAIARGNPQEVYLALWAIAFHDSLEAIAASLPILNDPLPERRLAAVHLLGKLQLPESRAALLPLFADPDLRVALHAFTGLLYDPFAKHQDDLFERLLPLVKRLNGKGQTLQSGIWPWLVINTNPEALLHMALHCLGTRDPKILIAYLPLMSIYDRIALAEKLTALPVWGEDVRSVLYKLVGERSPWVRDQARKLLASRPLDQDSTLTLEQFLTRKDLTLRRGLIALLLQSPDEAVFNSASRLLAQPHPLQRLAGLELLNGLVTEQRQLERAMATTSAYRAAAEKVTPEEATLIETLLAASQALERPTSENILGLISPDQRSPAIPPRPLAVTVDTPAARACLRSLKALIEEHRTTPILLTTWQGSEEMLLGNVQTHFPYPDSKLEIDEDENTRLPLAEIWRKWESDRSANLRDPDNLELFRAAQLLLRTRAAATVKIIEDRPSSPFPGMPALGAFLFEDQTDLPPPLSSGEEHTAPAPEPETLHLRYRRLITNLLFWLLRRQGMLFGQLNKDSHANLDSMSLTALNFLLNSAEAAFASVEVANIADQEKDQPQLRWPHQHLRDQLNRDGSLSLLRWYRSWHPKQWQPEHLKRYWQLLHWLDEPAPGMERMRPPLEALMDVYQIGEATEADILDHLGGPMPDTHGIHYSELRALSPQTPPQQMEQYPILKPLVAQLRARILEIELGRGELPTVATNLALSLRYSGGSALFVRLLLILKPTDLARGHSYDNREGKDTTLSHLLRVSYPAPEDSPEEFARQVKAAQITTDRLVAAALYAPQWAQHVEYALGWPSLTEAVWWIYAHTKGSNWSVDQEVRQTWLAQVAERTAISADDLIAGAVDVSWFWNGYRGLGVERWEQIYSAAKYASDGTGHGRARLYADAMCGKVSAQTLLQRMFEKRQPDVVRALGLAPLPASGQEREAAIAERYQAFQEFKRTGRTFGSQRRLTEETAIRIGLENLARTAGFINPLRLQWSMEAQLAADLRNGSLTVSEDDIHLTLQLDANSAEPQLTIVGDKGKILKTLPTRLKKRPNVLALLQRKREIEQQIARMRVVLEASMCRGDLFTASELLELLAHPVLSRLLRNLVFLRSEQNPTIGYPLCSERASGPQLLLRDYAGTTTPIDPTATDLRLAHPHDLLLSQDWHSWQRDCFTASRTQPFKQIFRELYVCTNNEIRHGDEAISQRYSGHQVQPRQALALLGQRGWVARYEEGVSRTFHAEKLTAMVSFAQGIFTPTEVEGLTVDQVFFLRRGDYKPVPLTSVPPRTFSETMRDLDLMVSVAHSGGVDPEATASTVEMRSALVTETCALIGLENVTLKSSHVLIAGTLGNYTLHLGSAVVHRQPGGALCIIPVHAQHQGRIFLPFADNDPKTAEVLSKVLLLAQDNAIKDPSILEQIL